MSTARFGEALIALHRSSDREFSRGRDHSPLDTMVRTFRLLLVFLVGALLGGAAIWSGAEASAPGLVQFMYSAFLALFGAALAAGVRKRRQSQAVRRRKSDST
jgi:MYXO-CTERM domain-containing protein